MNRKEMERQIRSLQQEVNDLRSLLDFAGLYVKRSLGHPIYNPADNIPGKIQSIVNYLGLRWEHEEGKWTPGGWVLAVESLDEEDTGE